MGLDRNVIRIIPVVASAAATLLSVSFSIAQPAEGRADDLFTRGQALLRQGKVQEACPLLEESQRLDAALGTLLNLALCHEQQGKLATARQEYMRAAARASRPTEVDQQRRTFAEARARALEGLVPKVRIAITGPASGMVVRLNERVLTPAELASELLLDPGTYDLRVGIDGSRPITEQRIVAEVGRTTVVPISLRGDAPEQKRRTASMALRVGRGSPTAPEPERHKTFAYATGAAGIAAVGAAVFFWARARTLDDRSEEARNRAIGFDTVDQELKRRSFRDYEAASDAQLVAQVAGGIGALALATSAYLIWWPKGGAGASRNASKIVVIPVANGAALTMTRTF